MAHQANIDDRRLWKDELVNIERDRSAYHVSPGYRPEIRQLTMDQPINWLRQGWQDLRRDPGVAIGYGALIAVIYAAIVGIALTTELYHVGLQLTAGFILLAPMMALGFYGISQKHERGESATFRDTLQAWRCNAKGMLGMGVLIVLLFVTWFMVSMQTAAFLAESKEELAMFLGAESFPEFFTTLITSLSIPMVLGYMAVGLVYVLVAFAFAAVSIPLMMDHPDTDPITALVVSWTAVTQNWKPMLLWAVLVAAITGIGLALFYIGLAVTMPLLGFATWHAYKETLGEWKQVEEKQAPYY
ncbi:MAG TPA: DUF2189 domain-containing protein [Gammaproteobacteria bacterium]|jgi:uncharacterized membrane protein